MEKESPLILVTNDDGIFAPGIQTLVRTAKDFGDVVVVAPDKPQSGMGHAITVNEPLRMREYELENASMAYSCSGTPVDSVKLAIYRILERKPDILCSGINHGSNCSINVLYSGTMSAAVEGAMEDIPSVGLSVEDHSLKADLRIAEQVTRQVISNLTERQLPRGICLNVNIPAIEPSAFNGVKICRQAKAYWEDEFEMRKDPNGREYYWLAGDFRNFDRGEDTDIRALRNNHASIVPVHFDMTAHHEIMRLNDWFGHEE